MVRLGRQHAWARGGVNKAAFAILLGGSEVALQGGGLGVALEEEDVGGDAVGKLALRAKSRRAGGPMGTASGHPAAWVGGHACRVVPPGFLCGDSRRSAQPPGVLDPAPHAHRE